MAIKRELNRDVLLQINIIFHIVCLGNITLADIYLRTGNFKKNVLRYYSRTTQGNETNDTPFESPIKQLLNLVIKVGVAVSKRQPRPCECKSTTLSKIEFMPLSVENFSVSKLESIAMFWGFLLRYITFLQVNWLKNGSLSKLEESILLSKFKQFEL